MTANRPRSVVSGTLLLVLVPLLAGAAAAQELKIEEQTLSNGMKLLLLVRKDEPAVSAGWVAHVGSVNERPGITGISHLFEHMMFKGTHTIGTTNYPEDLKIIKEQEEVRSGMREEEAKMRAAWRKGEIDDITKPENETPRYRELQKRFDELVKEQRKIIVKEEYDRIYTKAGGSGINAFTTNDMTGYFVTVPKNRLELWFWMESDRLENPVFREFYAERDVVYEERRRSVESTPTGRLDEAFDALFWHSTPYTWSVIGYPSDVAHITKAEADAYYSLYYAPNNLTAILVGDFDPKEARELAERYFGRIPRGKSLPPAVTTLPPRWEYDVCLEGEADTNPQIEIRWHTVPFEHRDSYPLQVLASVLNGRTGRLEKALVLPPDGPATSASASAGGHLGPDKYAGAFSISAEAKEGRTPADLRTGIDGTVARLKDELVPADELQKVKNEFAASAFRRLSSDFFILFQLIADDGYGDWREMNDGPRKIQAVSAEDVRRVARTYLKDDNRALELITRKEESKKEARTP